ncbi:uncharacterized protein STEHIDRAFT_125786 [Stereum hirsutum FP-91666 SS1]|uniref:uncharacterized protein n=1 Tax=Stereum hirsutum (strain FP-91666) TaxID=721885 RepID=UPI000444A597|nr:uncharacterized protein STEHIDRAFT_125786 [Stereum hirsutum FP-91666 SS1]EIM80795.1 hypothetical protein STEHIDRAFT_125786 [Stereum hirsutum FP-91666 SS1]
MEDYVGRRETSRQSWLLLFSQPMVVVLDLAAGFPPCLEKESRAYSYESESNHGSCLARGNLTSLGLLGCSATLTSGRHSRKNGNAPCVVNEDALEVKYARPQDGNRASPQENPSVERQSSSINERRCGAAKSPLSTTLLFHLPSRERL